MADVNNSRCDGNVEFYRHSLGEREKRKVTEALDSLVLTTGESTRAMEEALGEFLGVSHVVGVDSCTAGLHLSLLAAGIGPGDEVVVPAMTFVATANAVLMAGATPVFADVDPHNGCLTAQTIERVITSRTKAVIPVHLYGLLCDMTSIRTLLARRGILIIEDSAHCLEAVRGNVRPGSHSIAACFSFYATKAMTCGEGGAVATNDASFAQRLRSLSLHGMTSSAYDRYARQYEHWDMTELGWKYNLDNIRASLILSQVPSLDEHCERRRAICGKYESAFREMDGVDFPAADHEEATARHLFTIWVDPDKRDAFLAGLQGEGIGVAVNYRAIHTMSYYRRRFPMVAGSLPCAELIGERTISLPLYPKLRDEEVDRVIDAVGEVARKLSAPATASCGANMLAS
ncbi:MAG: DegT/DnrJ/EryC1/StrS family aminotransferase [Planctomycetota bacterium]|jgi:UDP-4-amino-4-deoxy-L-arabinose-oxoglutarate aminotransferase